MKLAQSVHSVASLISRAVVNRSVRHGTCSGHAHAGCTSIVDDYTWEHLPPLFSVYAAVLLANLALEYFDVSSTGLTTNGLFFLLLEAANCDPLIAPHGLKCLRQLRLGPPADVSPHAPPAAQWLPSIGDALAEVHANCPALELCCLVSHTSCHITGTSSQEELIELRQQWQALDDGHSCAVIREKGLHQTVLRTRFATSLQQWLELTQRTCTWLQPRHLDKTFLPVQLLGRVHGIAVDVKIRVLAGAV